MKTICGYPSVELGSSFVRSEANKIYSHCIGTQIGMEIVLPAEVRVSDNSTEPQQ